MSLIKEALAVAEKYPVFPTDNKKPCWSNRELGVGKGEGGYKIATQDPARVRELFSHRHANEIAVPMGEMSGLICVDVDLYKDPALEQWIKDSAHYLNGTMAHRTRSGGVHFFFKHPGDGIRFPATLRPGVDLKAGGTGYVCFPPTKGYTHADGIRTAKAFPLPMLEEALKAKGGSGRTSIGTAFNDATDEELIESIERADELYPALRSLSFRMPNRKFPDGKPLSEAAQVATLQSIMASSVAAQPGHPRHEDWEDRYSKIFDLVESANRRRDEPLMSVEAAEILAKQPSLIDLGRMIAADRPTGPQRETTPGDVEARVAERSAAASTFEEITLQSLHKATLPPVEWLVPGMIPRGGMVSLGGTSNVGKTRWLAAFAALGAAGSLPGVGLPAAAPFSTLWIANEERVDDIKRRIKAVGRQHGIKRSAVISIRGKDQGMLRLVGVNSAGLPEIDEDNVAAIVAEARRITAGAIIFDPYVTLSDAMDENSATSASIITKALILIVTLTSAAALHAHHTPKDRSKANDWYRGDSGAWRGSGAIYSALDCGYTLSHWMPKGKDARKSWQENYLDKDLSRWLVLDTGKIREGKALAPIHYELVGQPMADGEGDEVGVCRLTTEHEANNVLLTDAVDVIAADELAQAIFNMVGPGTHSPQTVHRRMKGMKEWGAYGSGTRLQMRLYPAIYNLLGEPVPVAGGTVQFIKKEPRRRDSPWLFEVVAHPLNSGQGVENIE